ncbi:MAG: translation elongation factor-like protein [Parcubacteria group bacterium]|nr:translation elongation factor-like protein [Parcubacteria group bacterium]
MPNAEKTSGAEKPIARVTHYYSHLGVAVVKLSQPLSEGEAIRIHGATTDFEQPVSSMQIEHEKIKTAKKGQEVGLKVKDRVREGDLVYRAEQ